MTINIKSLTICLGFLALSFNLSAAEGESELLEKNYLNEVIEKVNVRESSSEEVPHQIEGSSSFETIKSAKSNIYFLYGAEHLKLKNYYFDIPVAYNDSVKKWMDYFLNKGKEFFVRYSERAGRYAPLLGKILEDHGLPRDLIFLAMAESGFQNSAKSWAQAVGPWQFMIYTGRKFGLKVNWFVDERRDPIKATIAACRYLRKLYGDFGSWELAAAAYNAGEGKVSKAIRKYQSENFWDIRKGQYLKGETKNYVPKIMALAILGKNLESFGFKDIEFNEPLDFDEVDIPGGTDLILLSEFVGIPFEEIQRLNPEILRWYTPYQEGNYKLRMPVGLKQIWDKCCRSQDFSAKNFQTHTVAKPISLQRIASEYKVDVQVLAQLNKISPQKKMLKDETLILPFREGQDLRDPMYADLYELPRRTIRLKKAYREFLVRAEKRGSKISRPKGFYTVQKGDTLWEVARKTGVPIETIIRSNVGVLGQGRMLKPGDKLVIR